jgi:hypothetical protein
VHAIALSVFIVIMRVFLALEWAGWGLAVWVVEVDVDVGSSMQGGRGGGRGQKRGERR